MVNGNMFFRCIVGLALPAGLLAWSCCRASSAADDAAERPWRSGHGGHGPEEEDGKEVDG